MTKITIELEKLNIEYRPDSFSTIYNTEFGQQIWGFLLNPLNYIRYEVATRLKRPPVEVLDEQLFEIFGEEVKQDRVKQMIGHMIRQIMENLGYGLDAQNIKINNNLVFSSASRYKRVRN